jgi:hypothetical protein
MFSDLGRRCTASVRNRGHRENIHRAGDGRQAAVVRLRVGDPVGNDGCQMSLIISRAFETLVLNSEKLSDRRSSHGAP